MAGGKKGEKALNFGTRIKYPIKITKLYKNPGDSVRKQEPILQYSFEYTMELPNDRETLQLQKKTITNITDWNAPEDGKLLAWQVRVGDTIPRDRPCVTVEESCTHEIQYQGLCALCGKDMNEVNWASEQRDTERAPINMTHDQTSLTVSKMAATHAENQLQKRLLNQRKLSLVVDLDQTIIHACIDPTIGEWQQDSSNPNYEALRDVRRFQLEEGFHGLARGCWYYIKMRPRLTQFLETISSMYELHVYTMGTRTYATNIAQIVDPEQKFFGNRLISRDENGNIIAKSLQRLFPVSTHMAVIIDDRADVWPYNRHNLIKVNPYDFFKGTGDINSSFLPARKDLSTSSTKTPVSTTTAAAATDSSAPESGVASDTSPAVVVADEKQAIDSKASTAAAEAIAATDSTVGAAEGGKSAKTAIGAVKPLLAKSVDDGESVILQMQAAEQERTIEQQIKERPLLHMQEKLDKEDEEAAAAAGTSPQATEQNTQGLSPRPRHCVLYDDDNELEYLEKHLTRLHRDFYNEYDTRLSASQNGDHPMGRGGDDEENITALPDVGKVLGKLKEEVLHGAIVVLSGLVPLGLDVERSEIGLQTTSFGAKLQKQISKKVTHLVISSDRPRTQKVRQAARIPSIKIVNQHWLADCFSQWAWVDETPYLVNIHPADRERSATAGTPSEATDSETLSDQEGMLENGGQNPRIVIARPFDVDNDGIDAYDRDDESEDDDDVSPIAELGQFDWSSADDELAMFLAEGDDDDDDENDSQAYDDDSTRASESEDGDSGTPSSASKRKLGDDEEVDSERPASRGRSLFAKRQRLTVRSRSTSKLRTMVTTSSGNAGSHPLKQQETQMSENTNVQNVASSKLGDTPADADIDDDDLEAMLMAELDEEEAAAAKANG